MHTSHQNFVLATVLDEKDFRNKMSEVNFRKPNKQIFVSIEITILYS